MAGMCQSSVGRVLWGDEHGWVETSGSWAELQQCYSHGTERPLLLHPCCRAVQAVCSSEASRREEQPWPSSCEKAEGEGWREQKPLRIVLF